MYVPEIMGQLCTISIGFTDTSYPEDYVILYRGKITQIQCPPGLVKLTISDSMNVQRQPIFDVGTGTLEVAIPATGASPVTVTMDNTGVLHQPITSPDGTYDPTVQYYMEIDSEIFQYAATGILDANNVLCTRPALGTAAADHDVGTTITPSIGFGQNPSSGSLPGGIHALDWAQKLMLSGWDGPCITGVPVLSFVYDYLGNFVSNEFVLAASGFVRNDAYLDLGLNVGDYFQISNSASGNNLYGKITGIQPGVNGANTIIQTNQTFTLENPTSALVAFRSQYDTLPITAGVQASTKEVDVSTFQAMKATYFSTGIAYLRSYYNAPVMASDLIASDIMLPLGCYSISRYGRMSMAITKPPLPGAGTKMVQIDWTNVLDPDKIVVTRATNQRSFYNQISYEYDYDIATQAFSSIQYFIDTDSIAQFNDTEILPISAISVSSQLSGAELAQQRGTALLNRFKQCLIWIELTVNWSVGSLLEVSDIVILVDNGQLQIMNFATGERNLGVGLFEVIDRTYNIVAGNVSLKLLGGLGFDINSRFGLFAPSSVLDTGCTTTKLRLTPSFGQTTVAAEIAKWTPLVGMPIQVHDYRYSVTGQSVVVGTDPTDQSAIDISPPLLFAPSAGQILDLAPYPPGTNPQTDQLIKKLYAFISPTIPVLSGSSDTKFTLPASGAALVTVGGYVKVRNSDYSDNSNLIQVQAVSGGLITVKSSLGFVPTSGMFCEGVGWPDGTGAYLFD
jgi:hypothetical protein